MTRSLYINEGAKSPESLPYRKKKILIYQAEESIYRDFFCSSEDATVTNKATRKISQQAPGTLVHGEQPSSGYINVACNPGFHSDDEEGGFEEGVV